MFTGIVREIGVVKAVQRAGGGMRLTVQASAALEGARADDSISVNGACLTVEKVEGGAFQASLTSETLQRTTLGRLRPGDRVNLEPALRAGEPMGGHTVQGHVDGVGAVIEIVRSDGSATMAFALPAELRPYLVPKGSVAVDGVSLTVVEVRPAAFSVALVRHTLEHTTLGERKPGDAVNIEADVLAKYVESLLAARGGGGRRPLTLDRLGEEGYL
jgi:riboflavin synthase